MVTTLYLYHLGSVNAENQHNWIPLPGTDPQQGKLCTRKEMAQFSVSQWDILLYVT